MKNRSLVCFVFLLIITTSCNNRGHKNHDFEGKNDTTENLISTDKDSLTQNKSLNTNADSIKSGEIKKTVYELFGSICTLNGKVKKMEVISYEAKMENGYVVIDTAFALSQNTIEFNENGQIKQHTYYLRCGGGIWSISKVDSSGNPIVKEFYGNNTHLIMYCDYNQNNELIMTRTYTDDTNELIEYLTIDYDTINNCEVAKHFYYGKIDFKSHNCYDDDGNLVSSSYYDYVKDTLKNESHEYYSYQFDEYGNWIIEYVNFYYNLENKYSATIRKIEYYK